VHSWEVGTLIHGARSAALAVGNDVVDLADPRCRGRPLDERFMARVFDLREREWIHASADPDRTLWLAWAAKEAAFKVVSKLEGAPPPFSHLRFLVSERDGRGGVVRYGALDIPFREEPGGGVEHLHVVAWSPGEDASLEARVEALPEGPPPVEVLSDRERPAVYSPMSGWIRVLARADVARRLGIAEDGVEIVCAPGPPGRGIPWLFLHGEQSEWDVSLSHHGRFLAWALRGPKGVSRPHPRLSSPE
jgi:phosphopantetheinyl transferase (holo-ACP synthase)